ncbi:761_t:CDS:1, partial [Dentiscutata heterogama]
ERTRVLRLYCLHWNLPVLYLTVKSAKNFTNYAPEFEISKIYTTANYYAIYRRILGGPTYDRATR